MEPEDGVRQLEYVIDASLDAVGARSAATYRQSFERVAEHGGGAEVADLAAALARRVQNGDRPSPAEAEDHADRVLASGVAADGGQA